MTTLVLAPDHKNQSIEPISRLVNAALKLGEEVHVLTLGAIDQALPQAISKLAGITQLHILPAPPSDVLGFDDIAGALLPLMGEYQALITAHTGAGKHIALILAAQLSIAPVTGISAIIDRQVFERPIYAGSLIEQICSQDDKLIATIRTANFEPVEEQRACPIGELTAPPSNKQIEILEHIETNEERPDLSQAAIVIAGGRGVGSKEDFCKLEGFADQLGAALGASRIAVDMGWVPHHLQIGQTGVQIAPDLYIALGISGAVQHLAGIKNAGKIIAINKDVEAPIFKVANYGMIGDLHALLPQLQKALADEQS
ncbi:MAG: electron transfer flavoprotein subunit alpha/FixB family protein [bacterium]|nr:electron transfer flavoprotein subunit alpha/FixB family protein [bacterium]